MTTPHYPPGQSNVMPHLTPLGLKHRGGYTVAHYDADLGAEVATCNRSAAFALYVVGLDDTPTARDGIAYATAMRGKCTLDGPLGQCTVYPR